MRNEELYVLEVCPTCGNDIEIKVDENYIAMETLYSADCSYCGTKHNIK